MALSDWSSTAANNGTVLGVNIAENCPAANLNNALRQALADVAGGINISVLGTFLASSSLANARTALGVSGGSTSLNNFGALSNSANLLPYMTGSDAWSTTTLSSFMRTVLDDGDAATALATLGGIGASVTSNANGKSLNLVISGTTYRVQFGTVSVSGGAGAITYPVAFSSTPVCLCSGGSTSTGSDANDRITSVSTSGATVTSSYGSAHSAQWVALGT